MAVLSSADGATEKPGRMSDGSLHPVMLPEKPTTYQWNSQDGYTVQYQYGLSPIDVLPGGGYSASTPQSPMR